MLATISLAALMIVGNAAAAPSTAGQTGDPVAVSTAADHLALHVADVNASAAFYQGAFGLPEIFAPVNGPRWFSLGGQMALHLIGGRTSPVATGQSVHLALRTSSLDPTVAYLKSEGIRWQDWAGNAGAITLREDGVHQIFLQDPDGYWIEVNDALGAR